MVDYDGIKVEYKHAGGDRYDIRINNVEIAHLRRIDGRWNVSVYAASDNCRGYHRDIKGWYVHNYATFKEAANVAIGFISVIMKERAMSNLPSNIDVCTCCGQVIKSED